MDLQQLLREDLVTQHDRYAEHINPQFVKVLRTIGFDRQYVRASGAYLFDADGEKFLDCLAGYGVFNMGRNHPRIKTALVNALGMDLPNMIQMDAPPLAGQLAQRLLAKVNAPNIDTVFFTNSGTEAIEAALKFSKCATGRSRIVYCHHAFHGLTNGSLSCNGNDEFRDGFEPLLGDCVGVPFGDVTALAEVIKRGDVAAFIVEPVQGKGVYTAPHAYFQEAIALCHRHGTLVIADEVQTGLGRTGTWFAFQQWNATPDMVCVAKALSGGFIPCGALCYPRDVYKKVFHSMDRCVVHSNTFGRNTLAMVAGLTALQVLEDEQLVQNAATQGAALLRGFQAIAEEFEMVRAVRGHGLMLGMEFGEPRSLKLRTGWKLLHAVNQGIFGQLIVVPLYQKHHMLSQVAGHNAIVKFLPPLVLSDTDVAWILDALRDVVAEVHKFPGAAWDVGKGLAKRAMMG